MKFGEKIRLIRRMRGYSQGYMAEQLNVTQSTYSKYEREEIQLSHDQLNRILQEFDINKESIERFDLNGIFINSSGKDKYR